MEEVKGEGSGFGESISWIASLTVTIEVDWLAGVASSGRLEGRVDSASRWSGFR